MKSGLLANMHETTRSITKPNFDDNKSPYSSAPTPALAQRVSMSQTQTNIPVKGTAITTIISNTEYTHHASLSRQDQHARTHAQIKVLKIV